MKIRRKAKYTPGEERAIFDILYRCTIIFGCNIYVWLIRFLFVSKIHLLGDIHIICAYFVGFISYTKDLTHRVNPNNEVARLA